MPASRSTISGKYCNREVEKLLEGQSQEADIDKRKVVWEIERRLVEDAARPIIIHRPATSCWHPHFKGVVLQENTIYNRWRFEDVWLTDEIDARRSESILWRRGVTAASAWTIPARQLRLARFVRFRSRGS